MANLQYYGYAPRIYYGGASMAIASGDNTYNVGTTVAAYLVANESMLICEFDRTYGDYGCFLITAVNAGTGDITISPTPNGTDTCVWYYTRADAAFEYAWARSLGEVLKFRRYVDTQTDVVPVPGDGDDFTAVYDFEGNIMKIDVEGFYNVASAYDYCTDSTDNWDRLPQYLIPRYSMDSQQCERPAAFLWHNSERRNNGAQGHPVLIEKFSYKFAAGRCTASRTIIDYRLSAVVRNTEIC